MDNTQQETEDQLGKDYQQYVDKFTDVGNTLYGNAIDLTSDEDGKGYNCCMATDALLHALFCMITSYGADSQEDLDGFLEYVNEQLHHALFSATDYSQLAFDFGDDAVVWDPEEGKWVNKDNITKPDTSKMN
jgi:hypothetical protein